MTSGGLFVNKVIDIYFPLKCRGISGAYDKILTSLPVLCITKLSYITTRRLNATSRSKAGQFCLKHDL
jgi:hypothetical protein